MFEKRDGGIINKLILENGTIIEDAESIDKLLATTIEEIQVDSKWKYLEEKPFNLLPEMKIETLHELILTLATNKAITHNGLSDHMFKKEKAMRTEETFKDLG